MIFPAFSFHILTWKYNYIADAMQYNKIDVLNDVNIRLCVHSVMYAYYRSQLNINAVNTCLPVQYTTTEKYIFI